ncbi:hypothetical protein FGI00_17495 [Dickeya zeae]|nr:hypothetical protein FGI00_17495 [Dickeya zeae]
MTVLRLLGRHCPEPTQHGAAHAVTGSQTALPPARNARAALDGENAVVRWARQQGRLHSPLTFRLHRYLSSLRWYTP